MGVPSLLACVVCKEVGVDVVVGLGTGGVYVYPRAGVKMGRVEAVERSFVREVTVESCWMLASRTP